MIWKKCPALNTANNFEVSLCWTHASTPAQTVLLSYEIRRPPFFIWPNLLLSLPNLSLMSSVHFFPSLTVFYSFYVAFCVSFPFVSLSAHIDRCFLNGCQEVPHTHVHATLSPIGNSVSTDRKMCWSVYLC